MPWGQGRYLSSLVQVLLYSSAFLTTVSQSWLPDPGSSEWTWCRYCYCRYRYCRYCRYIVDMDRPQQLHDQRLPGIIHGLASIQAVGRDQQQQQQPDLQTQYLDRFDLIQRPGQQTYTNFVLQLPSSLFSILWLCYCVSN